MANKVITEKDLISTTEAAEALNVCKAQVCKYVREGVLRRVRDRTNKNFSYIYKPDIDKMLTDRFYFEGESNSLRELKSNDK